MINLTNLLSELQNYKHSKEEAFEIAVSTRLDNSLRSYLHSLTQSEEYLKYRNSTSVLRNL